jgi:hypothetical protein
MGFLFPKVKLRLASEGWQGSLQGSTSNRNFSKIDDPKDETADYQLNSVSKYCDGTTFDSVWAEESYADLRSLPFRRADFVRTLPIPSGDCGSLIIRVDWFVEMESTGGYGSTYL